MQYRSLINLLLNITYYVIFQIDLVDVMMTKMMKKTMLTVTMTMRGHVTGDTCHVACKGNIKFFIRFLLTRMDEMNFWGKKKFFSQTSKLMNP